MLEGAIRRGLDSREFFGLAAGYADGRYLDLTLGEGRAFLSPSDYLVKPAVATVQIEADAAAAAARRPAEETADNGSLGGAGVGGAGLGFEAGTESVIPPVGGEAGAGAGAVPRPPRQKTAFRMSARIDNTRVNRSIQTIMEEVVNQLNALDGADVELTFEVSARVAGGIPAPTVRAVSENCATIGIGDFEFREG